MTNVAGVDYTPEGIEAVREVLIKHRDEAMKAWPEGIDYSVLMTHVIAYLSKLRDVLAKSEPTLSTITPEVARHVLFHFTGTEGYQAGSFTSELMQLLDAWQRADNVNSAKLAAAFPDYALAIKTATEVGGLGVLRVIAGLQSDGTVVDGSEGK